MIKPSFFINFTGTALAKQIVLAKSVAIGEDDGEDDGDDYDGGDCEWRICILMHGYSAQKVQKMQAQGTT